MLAFGNDSADGFPLSGAEWVTGRVRPAILPRCGARPRSGPASTPAVPRHARSFLRSLARPQVCPSILPVPSAFQRFRYLLGLFGEHAWSLGAGAGFLGLTLWMSLAIPRYLQEAIDLLAADQSGSAVLAKVWIILAFAVAIVITRSVSRMLFLVPGRRVEFDLKNRLLAHLLGQEREYFLANPTGELISRINNDINGVRMLVGMGTMMLIQTAGMLTLAPWYMYRISPRLTLYCAVPIVIGFLVLQLAVQRMRRNQQWQMKALQELSDFTVESYGGLDPLKSFRGLGWAEGRFAALSGEVRDAGLGMTTVRAWFFPLLTHLVNGLKVMLVLVGGFAVVGGEMTIGGFTAFAVYLSMLVGPLMGATFMMFLLQRGMTGLGSLLEVFAAEPARPAPRPGASLPARLVRGLAVERLRFAYPDEPDRPVLDGVSLRVAPGEVVGVFGPVGSGKTTLVNLLNHYLAAPPGAVHLDGVDLRDLESSELRRHVVTVTQEPFLFSDTLQANVAFGVDEGMEREEGGVGARDRDEAGARREPAGRERPRVRAEPGTAGNGPIGSKRAENESATVDALVERAVADAALGPDVSRMSAGLQTLVGERGITLSGGQKQRVAFARAILKPCDLLILDDVLSAVDHDTERVLVDRIYSLTKARSILVVSHRISVLERADRVFVLDRGRLVDEGSHRELAAREGPYREAWRRQRSEEAMH